VDDPYTFGAIAATSPGGDVYAVFASDLGALAFPSLPSHITQAILQGELPTVAEAGAVVAGRSYHRDGQRTYGLCVTGVIDLGDGQSACAARPCCC